MESGDGITRAEYKDWRTGILRIRKIAAADLPNLEFVGRIDPFIEFSYLGLYIMHALLSTWHTVIAHI